LIDPLVTSKREPRDSAPAFLRPKEAAAFLSISPSLLAKVARMGRGPKQRRIGRCVLYAIADLREYMEAAC
jgi:predicted DNA-binding transcriptional regulator AlpA